MKLLEALEIVNNKARADTQRAANCTVALACGFVPLHFKTFLQASVAQRRPDASTDIAEGLYGDLPGNLERLNGCRHDGIVAVVEWADLDPRLGARSTGGWGAPQLADLVAGVQLQLQRIADALKRQSHARRVLVGPTLPLPPVFYWRPQHLSSFEADLRVALSGFYRDAVESGVVVISPQAVDCASPSNARFDLKSELAAGFPYTLEHAEILARLVATELFPPSRKKGLITDLDDTVWQGILGETGVDGVCWTLERNAHMHALYQQFLGSLAACGTLLAVASKNDPSAVEQALARRDLLLNATALFPIEAHWGPKSQSVQRILAAWNVDASAVVFVDDSPMELAEVEAAVPGIECLLFPRDRPERIWDLMIELRNRFGASEITPEDSLRLESLRSRQQFESERTTGAGVEHFLTRLQAEIVFAPVKAAETRPFELLNKTNQFNLNGRRLTEAEWGAVVADPSRFVLKAHYKDRFGPLGEIAVLIGSANGPTLTIDSWVMSCRAFSRQIEYRFVQYLFERFGAEAVCFAFTPTPRNGPVQEFLSILSGETLVSPMVVSRRQFEARCPTLCHLVREES